MFTAGIHSHIFAIVGPYKQDIQILLTYIAIL